MCRNGRTCLNVIKSKIKHNLESNRVVSGIFSHQGGSCGNDDINIIPKKLGGGEVCM